MRVIGKEGLLPICLEEEDVHDGGFLSNYLLNIYSLGQWKYDVIGIIL
jgi:hypothetical protein